MTDDDFDSDDDGASAIQAMFEKFEDEYINFDRIPDAEKLHPRPDLCAFLLLDRLVPGPNNDMIAGAEHDKFYVSTDPADLEGVATEADILTLVRCGVMYDEETDSLMFFA